ncbi:MAG: transcriptional regulator [Deltaproteobacteria bacterium RIFOXYD12_FULL_57_12]|nr:MAG: transcriptional regulator [Deltaproteobacteria bacterium RIFOXYD12_FULL_57_12]
MAKTLVEMTADIVQSQCGTQNMTTDELTLALQSTFKALQALQAEEAQASTETPAAGETATKTDINLSPEKSLQKNKIICLECGQEFKMLSPKHLKSHGLTGKEYRAKHGFSMRQPLCAKSLSDRRKKAGKERGLPDNLKKAIANRKKRKTTSKK